MNAKDSTPGKPVFNRTVTLADTWAKIEKGKKQALIRLPDRGTLERETYGPFRLAFRQTPHYIPKGEGVLRSPRVNGPRLRLPTRQERLRPWILRCQSPESRERASWGFDGCPQGWCGECEKRRLECGGWNDESEAFCNAVLVCVHCFEEVRRRNTRGDETP